MSGEQMMTRDEKREFVIELCNSIRNGIVHQVHKFPEGWDGHELRQLIADVAENSAKGWRGKSMDRARRAAYTKALAKHNIRI